MKLTIKYFTIALALFLLGASTAFALPSSYGVASHTTTKWQELATATSQTGVFWSVDGGTTWTQDTDLKLGLGDTIQFQFNMYKQNYGTHYADFLKAWVDWGHDGTFDSTDVAKFGMQELEGYGTNAPSGDTYTFYSGAYTMTDAMFGDLFLRARVTCSESLGSQSPFYNYYAAFLPTGNLWQGEVEEWSISISKTPLPPSVLMFGTGLIGMLAVTRRRFLKF
jgi:hypothetical protein